MNGERGADVEDIAGFLDQCELTSRLGRQDFVKAALAVWTQGQVHGVVG